MSETKTGTATLVRDNLPKMRGHAALYRLDPPMYGEHYHVVVSAVDLTFAGMFDEDDPTCETYIFPADEFGVITSWGELDGSLKNTKDHAEALADAGYAVSA